VPDSIQSSDKTRHVDGPRDLHGIWQREGLLTSMIAAIRGTAVILTALGLEYMAVREHLGEELEKREARGTLYEFGTFTGKHGVWTVAIAETGEGNTTAGIQLERAVQVFSPQVVLFVGVAGGRKDLKLGDVIAADAVYDYEDGKDTESRYLPRIKTAAPSHRLVQHARAVARNEHWRNRIKPAPPQPPPSALVKPIAAGGKVVAHDHSQTAHLLDQFCGDAVAVDKESHGFLHGAYANEDVSALVVRGISDLLTGKDEESDRKWQPIAARHAAAFAFELLADLEPAQDPNPGARSGTRAQAETAALDSGAGRADLAGPSASPPPPRARRLLRQRDLAAAIMAIITVLAGAAIVARTFAAGADPASAFRIEVTANSDKLVLTPQLAAGRGYVTALPIRQVPPPPVAADSCADRYEWAHRPPIDAVDADSSIAKVDITPKKSAVMITGAQLHFDGKAPPLTAILLTCGGKGGPIPTHFLQFDLDTGSKVFYPFGGDTPGNLNLGISRGKTESLLIQGGTERCNCRWRVELSIDDGKSMQTVTIGPDGATFGTAQQHPGQRPFETTGSLASAPYRYRDGQWRLGR
jgi:nucleoside phosphorylase